MSSSLPNSDRRACRSRPLAGPYEALSASARLLAEIIAAIAVAQAAVTFILPAVAPGVSTATSAILNATMLSLLAGPVILWRVRAAVARTAGNRADTLAASRRWLVMTAAGILLVGFIATGLAGSEARLAIREEAHARFDRLTERLVGEAARRINQPGLGLAGARGVYAASKSVDRAGFGAYVASRDLPKEFPGALGMGFIQRVMRADLPTFIAAERADGAPDFAIKTLAVPGSPLEHAPDLYVIKHCFPKERNAKAWGLDIGSEPARRAAAERAVATGEPTITGRITLVQDQHERTGFLYFLPVYQNGTTPRTPEERNAALVGLAFAPLVLEEALVGVDKSLEGFLDFEIFDGEAMTSDAMLFDLDGHLRPLTGQIDASAFAGRMFEQHSTVNVGGRTWTFSTSTTPKFQATVSQSMPLVVGVGGVLLSLLLTTVFWSLGTGRARARALAQTITADLTAAKAQADRLGDIARRTSNAVVITDVQGRIEWVNEGFTRISGYTLDEVKGKKPGSFLQGPSSDPAAARRMGEATARGEGCRTEIVNYGKDGREYTLDIEIMPRRDEAGVLTGFMAIESDITEQKATAEVLRVERERLEMAASAALMGLWDWNPQTGYVRYDQRWADMLGYSLGELRPHVSEWSDRVHPDDLPAAMEAAQKAMFNNTPYSCEHRMRHRDGSWRWILDQGRVVTRSEQGEVTRFVGSHIDITERKEFEGRLAASERRLRTIIEAEPECVKVLGIDGELLEMNAAGLTMLEADSVEQVRARGLMHFVLPEHHAAFESLHAKVLEGRSGSLSFEVKGLKGERRWLDTHAVPLRDEAGTITGILGVTRDITARKKAEVELKEISERLQLATRAGGVGTWEYRIADNKVTWDDQMFRLYGITREQFGGAYEAWRAGVHPEDRDRCDHEIQQALSGDKDFDTEFRVVWPDGTTRHIHGLATVQRDSAGQPVRMVGTNWDVTERKHNEMQIQDANGRLAAALKAAEAASETKSAFLANMSHEIRTPLTAILGYADVLREDGDLAVAPEQRLQTIDTIRNAGQHLLTVINDILDLSKIEADRMTVENIETPIATVLNELESLMRPRAAGKGLTLEASLTSPIPERIASDPTRLRQILLNLVGNAVKFTEHGNVTIRAGAAESDGHARLVIDVEDSGPGMTPEQAGRLFQAFGQADETVTRVHGGTGLGLTISRRLAAMMGGDVKLLRTEPGKGSCFRLVLPLQPVPGAAMVSRLEAVQKTSAGNVAAPTTKLTGRILLAEDGTDNQRLICFHLKKAGATVDVAGNGRIALEMLDEAAASGTVYDLLLTDMQMPEMDGYTLARTLRKRGSTMPIVALTAHAMAEDRARCVEAGCDDYATKPIDKAALLATCAAWMGKAVGVGALAKAA